MHLLNTAKEADIFGAGNQKLSILLRLPSHQVQL
jgi:hypothetical protein